MSSAAHGGCLAASVDAILTFQSLDKLGSDQGRTAATRGVRAVCRRSLQLCANFPSPRRSRALHGKHGFPVSGTMRSGRSANVRVTEAFVTSKPGRRGKANVMDPMPPRAGLRLMIGRAHADVTACAFTPKCKGLLLRTVPAPCAAPYQPPDRRPSGRCCVNAGLQPSGASAACETSPKLLATRVAPRDGSSPCARSGQEGQRGRCPRRSRPHVGIRP